MSKIKYGKDSYKKALEAIVSYRKSLKGQIVTNYQFKKFAIETASAALELKGS